MIVQTTALSCGALKVENSKNHADGKHTGKTTNTVEVVCADGYKGGAATVTCKAVTADSVAWHNMPTCEGPCKTLRCPVGLLYMVILTSTVHVWVYSRFIPQFF